MIPSPRAASPGGPGGRATPEGEGRKDAGGGRLPFPLGNFPVLLLWLLLSALLLSPRLPGASFLVEGGVDLLPRLERAGLLEGRPVLFFSEDQTPRGISRLLQLVDLVVLDDGNRLAPFLEGKNAKSRPAVLNLRLAGLPGTPSPEVLLRRIREKERKAGGDPLPAVRKLSPARYKVSVGNPGRGGFWVVLGETFHPAWRAWIRDTYSPGAPETSWSLRALWADRGRRASLLADHFPANGFANAWYVPPGREKEPFDVILEFGHQAPFEAGLLLLAVLAFLLLGGASLLLFRKWRKISPSFRSALLRVSSLPRGRLVWILPLLLVAAWHGLRFFGEGYPLGHDLLASLSLSRFAGGTIRTFGVLSTWNEQSYGGYSLYSVFPSTFPLLVLALGSLLGSMVLAVKIYFFALFYLAAFPAYLLGRAAGFSPKGSLAAAAMYTLLPIHFLEGNLEGHGLVLAVFFLAPLWVYTAIRFLEPERFSLRWFLASGALTYLLFAGHPQYPFFFHPFLFAFALLLGLSGRDAGRALRGGFLSRAALLALWALPAVLLDPGWLELFIHKGFHVASFNGDGRVPLSFAAQADLLPMLRMRGCCLAGNRLFDLFGLAVWGGFWALLARRLGGGEGRGKRGPALLLFLAFLLSLGVVSPLFPFLFRNLSFLFRAIRTPGRFLVAAAVLAIPFFAWFFEKAGGRKGFLFFLLLLAAFTPEIGQAFLTFSWDRKGFEARVLSLTGGDPDAYVEKLPFDYCDGEERLGTWRNTISPFYLSGGRYRTLGGAEPAQSLRSNRILEAFRRGSWRDPDFLRAVAREIPLKGLLVERGRDAFLWGEPGFSFTGGEVRILGRTYRLYRVESQAPPHVFAARGGGE